MISLINMMFTIIKRLAQAGSLNLGGLPTLGDMLVNYKMSDQKFRYDDLSMTEL